MTDWLTLLLYYCAALYHYGCRTGRAGWLDPTASLHVCCLGNANRPLIDVICSLSITSLRGGDQWDIPLSSTRSVGGGADVILDNKILVHYHT